MLGALLVRLQAAPASDQLGFLGPRGTFSEQAADTYRQAAPELTTMLPYETMTALVMAVRDGRVARGIIPVAATAGFPAESSQLLLSNTDPGVRVVGEVVVPVDLHLLVKAGTASSRIARIASHPSALAEADAFLRTNYPSIPREETSSTAAAAEAVSRSDGSLAAVASAAAARLYGLEILTRTIQENRQNATSFWILARVEDASGPETIDRLVILVDAPPGSSALSAISADLHAIGLEIVFVNSRPLPGALYGYRFLVSLASATNVPRDRLEAALAGRTPTGGRVLVLGSFRAQR